MTSDRDGAKDRHSPRGEVWDQCREKECRDTLIQGVETTILRSTGRPPSIYFFQGGKEFG